MSSIPHSSGVPGLVAGSGSPLPLPPPLATRDMPKGDGSGWTAAQEQIVRGPYEYILQTPGKDIRKQLIQAFNAWLQVPENRLAGISRAITMLHNASLLIDDVEDSSLLRRGEPVAHHVFGVAQTLNAGNYVYFCALREILELGNPELVEIFTQELCNLHRGQGMDLYWRDTLTCPTEQEYLQMVGNKTGGLFRLTIKMMQAESTKKTDCVALVNLIGLIFQIRDDYMNLWSKDYTANKGVAEDLTEGKFSFPVIHAIRSDPSNLQLLNILRQRPTEVAVKKYAIDYMNKRGSFDYCRKVVGEMMEQARQLVAEIDAGEGKGAGVLAILDKFGLDEERVRL